MYIRFSSEKTSLTPYNLSSGRWKVIFKSPNGQTISNQACGYEASAISAYRKILDQHPQLAEISPKRLYRLVSQKNKFGLPKSLWRPKRPHNLLPQAWKKVKEFTRSYGRKAALELQRYLWRGQPLVNNAHMQVFTSMQLSKVLGLRGTIFDTASNTYFLNSKPILTREIKDVVGSVTVEATEDQFRILEIAPNSGEKIAPPSDTFKLDWCNTRFEKPLPVRKQKKPLS